LLSRDVSLESRVAGNIKRRQFFRGVTGPGAPEQTPSSVPMTEFVPSGYISIREALDRLGRELFPSEWTGEEHTARSGLINPDEWVKTKDLPGTGMSGGGMRPGGVIIERRLDTPVTARVPSSGDPRERNTEPTDPCDPSYQAEYRAAERHATARHELRVRLEAGHLEAAILDPWSGELYRAPARMWRQDDADRIIKHGRAQKPPIGNVGSLLVKRFADASVHAKPMPKAKIGEAIKALKEKTATESLTRSQQAEFVRKSFPSYHVTERQLSEIFRAIPVLTGRPRKSNRKV
jgi:hypothetical protein